MFVSGEEVPSSMRNASNQQVHLLQDGRTYKAKARTPLKMTEAQFIVLAVVGRYVGKHRMTALRS